MKRPQLNYTTYNKWLYGWVCLVGGWGRNFRPAKLVLVDISL